MRTRCRSKELFTVSRKSRLKAGHMPRDLFGTKAGAHSMMSRDDAAKNFA